MRKVRILIVEDERLTAEDIKTSLEALGYSVPALISSGSKAIKMVKKYKPDLVLMDIVLRGKMNGIEAADQIKYRFNIPVVYLTAYADETTLARAKVTEPFGYIIKPFEERELHSVIEMALYRSRMEQELKASQPWLATTLKSIGDAVIASDTNGLISFMNPVAEALTGWKKSEALNKSTETVFRIINKTTRKSVEHPVTIAIKTNDIVGLANHTLLIAKDGSEIDIDDSAAPIRNENGEINGVVLVFRDVTQRRLNQEKIRKLSRAVEQSPNIVMITDADGKIEYVNPQFTNIMGYSAKEIIGRNPAILRSGYMLSAIHEKIWATITKGEEWQGEFQNVKKNGELFWESVIISPILSEEGTIIHYLVIMEDVTERRRMQEEIFKARKLEALGVLAGGIAHDFNNILTGILGNISLAKMAVNQSERAFRLLIEAEKASVRAKDLTQQLLTFSSGGAPIKEAGSIILLVKESANFAISGSMVRCDFSLPRNLWHIEADMGQLSQVINNLVINAKHAMPDGGAIKISAQNITFAPGNRLALKPGNYVKLIFEEHGVGISKENIPKIFDPYFTTRQNGSGLGLTTAYSIIQNHEGKITVDSVENRGTTFAIYLPATSLRTEKKKSAIQKPLHGVGRILIMDDEEIVREVAVNMLTELGYEVTLAANGEEAIELFRLSQKSSQPFDLVIMDLTVRAGMGGKESGEKLRKLDKNVKIVVSSGYSANPIMANFKEYGFCDVITKPYRLEELSQVVASAMNIEKDAVPEKENLSVILAETSPGIVP
ncbi:response regulator [candidate division KSB1 bacterium]|nr:response regulator [candidate division KSB1 bacterium]